MDSLSGVLLIPPDRAHFISRPVWKTRWVVIGRRTATKKDRQNNNLDLDPLAKPFTDEYCISVYKHKEDPEPVHQWPAHCVADCQVEMVSHRRNEPVLPTLIITLSDKERKRRSTRAAGLISNKESGTSNLWFRTPPDDHHPSLHDWAQFILSKKHPASSDGPSSSMYPGPFAPRSREAAEYHMRPGSGNDARTGCRFLQHKSSSATYSTGRECPPTFSSDSPSLRSKRSDVSSPSSVNQHPMGKGTYTIGGQYYTTVLPSDGAYPGEFAEGWAMGHPGLPFEAGDGEPLTAEQAMYLDVSAPPAPGETILDRAFQLGHIPGAEVNIPGQEKFSSIARFDALMRELEEKAKQKAAKKAEDADSPPEGLEKADSHEPTDVKAADEPVYAPGASISPSAQRALDFLAARHDDPPSYHRSQHRPSVSRNHLSFHADALPERPRSPPARPHTAHAKSRPRGPVAPLAPRPERGGSKRLSLSEFTRRLSSGSLLLNQNLVGRRSRRMDGQCWQGVIGEDV